MPISYGTRSAVSSSSVFPTNEISGIVYTPIGRNSPAALTVSPKAVQAARRPCSADVAARLGKPITSPTAKMCGAAVR